MSLSIHCFSTRLSFSIHWRNTHTTKARAHPHAGMQMLLSETLKHVRHCKLFLWCPQLQSNAVNTEQKSERVKNREKIMYYKCVINVYLGKVVEVKKGVKIHATVQRYKKRCIKQSHLFYSIELIIRVVCSNTSEICLKLCPPGSSMIFLNEMVSFNFAPLSALILFFIYVAIFTANYTQTMHVVQLKTLQLFTLLTTILKMNKSFMELSNTTLSAK